MTPIKTALASYGMSGRVFHAPLLFTNDHFELYKILERRNNNSHERYPGSIIVRSYDELCSDSNVELIVVNTPDNTHYNLARQALESDKHVVVEKPFTLKYSDAMKLAELADKRGLMLSVFHNRRWDGDFKTVKKIISENLLGRLVEFESNFNRYRNFIREGTWKEDPESGTGTLYNLGSHMLDQALVLFGKPSSVIADIRTMRTGGKVDDNFEVWLGYPDTKVSICGSYLVREPVPRYILHGTEGSFLKWGTDPQEKALNEGKLPAGDGWGKENNADWGILHTTIDGKEYRQKYETLPGNYHEYYNDIYHAIRENRTPEVSALQAGLVIRVIEASFESVKTKKAIILD